MVSRAIILFAVLYKKIAVFEYQFAVAAQDSAIYVFFALRSIRTGNPPKKTNPIAKFYTAAIFIEIMG